jgi:hypothetical protein
MSPDSSPWRRHVAVVVVCGLVFAAYANHFRNGFHFDDGHTIVDNVYVRDLRHIPRYSLMQRHSASCR